MNAAIVIIIVCFSAVLIHALFQLDWHRVFFVKEPVRPWVITQPVKPKKVERIQEEYPGSRINMGVIFLCLFLDTAIAIALAFTTIIGGILWYWFGPITRTYVKSRIN